MNGVVFPVLQKAGSIVPSPKRPNTTKVVHAASVETTKAREATEKKLMFQREEKTADISQKASKTVKGWRKIERR